MSLWLKEHSGRGDYGSKTTNEQQKLSHAQLQNSTAKIASIISPTTRRRNNLSTRDTP
ncbi:MAG: hypothetical protein ABL309_05090 [Phycisphaerales bacterium]